MTVLPSSARLPIKARPVQILDTVSDQPFPQSPDAERAVLGAILINNICFYRCKNLSADMFFKDAHQAIYGTMALMVEEGHAIEILTLKEHLAKHNLLDAVGGYAYITSLVDVVPDIANVERYAAIVERLAKKRALIVAGNALMRAGFDPETEPEEIATSAMAALSPQATREDRQARPLLEVLDEAYGAMESLRERNLGVSLTSGWPTLDEHKVFTPTFTVTGAATKAGKSAAMMSLSRGLASNGNPVAIFSLESSPRELGLRHTSSMTGIPHSRVRDWRTFSERDFARVAECRKTSAKMPIFITRSLWNAEDIVMEIRRLKAVHGLKVAFIDYIQNVTLRMKADREERLHEISKLFLETALDQEVHIHALSQLRDGAGEDGKRLGVNDIAYAKSIGKSARIVNLFSRPDTKRCIVRWQIEANNEERTNDFDAHFDEVSQTFAEGTCLQNNCRSLGNVPMQSKLV